VKSQIWTVEGLLGGQDRFKSLTHHCYIRRGAGMIKVMEQVL
jgi:hypothetical protein